MLYVNTRTSSSKWHLSECPLQLHFSHLKGSKGLFGRHLIKTKIYEEYKSILAIFVRIYLIHSMLKHVHIPFLYISFGALIAIESSSVMLTLTLQKIRIFSRWRANESVAITYTSTTNTDFFDGIIVLKEKKIGVMSLCRVSLCGFFQIKCISFLQFQNRCFFILHHKRNKSLISFPSTN